MKMRIFSLFVWDEKLKLDYAILGASLQSASNMSLISSITSKRSMDSRHLSKSLTVAWHESFLHLISQSFFSMKILLYNYHETSNTFTILIWPSLFGWHLLKLLAFHGGPVLQSLLVLSSLLVFHLLWARFEFDWVGCLAFALWSISTLEGSKISNENQ